MIPWALFLYHGFKKRRQIMIIKYQSPYHNMLAELVKNDYLNDVEHKIFDILATARKPYSVRELGRVVFGLNSKCKGLTPTQELEIRDAIESLQSRAIPIVQCKRVKYYLADNIEIVINMILGEEKKIEYLQNKLKVLWINYGRQVDQYHKLKNDGPK
jgi:hypothetical protein